MFNLLFPVFALLLEAMIAEIVIDIIELGNYAEAASKDFHKKAPKCIPRRPCI